MSIYYYSRMRGFYWTLGCVWIIIGGLSFAVLAKYEHFFTLDYLYAIYLLGKHASLDVCLILAARAWLTAMLVRFPSAFEMGLRKFHPSVLLIIIPAFFFVWAGQVTWDGILTAFHFTLRFTDWGLPLNMSQHPQVFWTQCFYLILLAPFAEEILFRGAFYRWLKAITYPSLAILASAFFFTLAHGDVAGFGGIFMMGVVAALFYKYTRSIYPGFMLHCLWNVVFVVLTVWGR